MQYEKRGVGRRAGFTVVELLVVIAIIALLVALLLPGIDRARDYSRTVACASKMKQLFTLGESFRADTGRILPAWYYPWRLDGPYAGEYVGTGSSDFGWSYNDFGHMLIDRGYLDTGNRKFINTTSSDTAIATLTGWNTNSILTCTNGYAPKDYQESWMQFAPYQNLPPDPKRRLMRLLASYTPTKANAKAWYLSNYSINSNAGSFNFYHDVSVNQGLYPRKDWKSNPGRVGYMFESNLWQTGATHQTDAFNPALNSWDYVSPHNPTAPHLDLSKSNVIYADGHRELLGDTYDATRPWPLVFF